MLPLGAPVHAIPSTVSVMAWIHDVHVCLQPPLYSVARQGVPHCAPPPMSPPLCPSPSAVPIEQSLKDLQRQLAEAAARAGLLEKEREAAEGRGQRLEQECLAVKEELQRVTREVEQREEAVAARDRWATIAAGEMIFYVALLWRHNLYCYCNTVLLPSPPPLSSPLPPPPSSLPPPPSPLPPSPSSSGRKLDSLAHTHRVELSELKIRWG